MNNSKFHLMQDCGNDWSKYYDPNLETTLYYNPQTDESSWTVPKKIFTEDCLGFLSLDQLPGDEGTTLPTEEHRSRCPSESFCEKCLKCGSTEDVLEVRYCIKCYQEINSYDSKLISTYKIRCNSCGGWGVGLVKPNGFCNWCYFRRENNLPINNYLMSIFENEEEREPPFPRCLRCRGWGKDLVTEYGKCAHCIREETQEAFDRLWKKKCRICKGWGLYLVGEDGLCSHCRRTAPMNSFNEFEFFRFEDLIPNVVTSGQDGRCENQYLQKRKLDTFLHSFEEDSLF